MKAKRKRLLNYDKAIAHTYGIPERAMLKYYDDDSNMTRGRWASLYAKKLKRNKELKALER